LNSSGDTREGTCPVRGGNQGLSATAPAIITAGPAKSHLDGQFYPKARHQAKQAIQVFPALSACHGPPGDQDPGKATPRRCLAGKQPH